jgi:hypothetical protein
MAEQDEKIGIDRSRTFGAMDGFGSIMQVRSPPKGKEPRRSKNPSTGFWIEWLGPL